MRSSLAGTPERALEAKTCRRPSGAVSNWRDLPLLRMKDASEILGLSVASLYRLAHDGRLKLKKLEGRTLVETKSLIAVVESASDWTPATRTAKATEARKTHAAASWG